MNPAADDSWAHFGIWPAAQVETIAEFLRGMSVSFYFSPEALDSETVANRDIFCPGWQRDQVLWIRREDAAKVGSQITDKFGKQQ